MSGDRTVLVRESQAVLQRIGSEAVIHDRASGRVHVINGSAARLWELCDGGRTLDEITSAFAAGYAVEPAVVADDVAALVAHFRSLGLVA